MTTKILCVGECMLELAPLDQAGQFQMAYAGDTFNTAWYLRRSGADIDVDYFTAVGDDAASQRLLDFVKTQNIGTGSIVRMTDRTIGLYMIELQDGERSFSYWRSQSAARCLADDPAALQAGFDGRDIIYLSGITIGILSEAGRQTLRDALRQARARGTQIVFDPNLRPKLWVDETTMCREVMEVAAISDIVLPSHDDEATHFGDASTQATLERYRDVGAGTVIVKDGAGAILYLHNGITGSVSACETLNIVDTTAAGDSFNAGFLVGLLNGDVEQAIAQGCDLASKVISGRGALVDV